MIDWYQAIILALVQGLTEFLPISSSAHLVIPSLILGWPDQGLAFDVSVHMGTLFAVLWFYRSDLVAMTISWSRSLHGGGRSTESNLVWYILIATIPAGIFGTLGRDFIESELRSVPVIATTTVVFGLILALADRRAEKSQFIQQITLPLALLIGIAQAVALVPGVSRSGVTISAGLMLGLGRQGAARFSFLLSIPVIASAAALKIWDLTGSAVAVDWLMLAVVTLVSGLMAYFCIAVFLRLLDRIGMMPFVYYRLVLGAGLFALFFFS